MKHNVDYTEKYNVIITPSKSHQTFYVINPSGGTDFGVFYTDTNKSYVFCIGHQSIESLINTSVHESIHSAIQTLRDWEQEELDHGKLLLQEKIEIDDIEEHIIIRLIFGEEYLGSFK